MGPSSLNGGTREPGRPRKRRKAIKKKTLWAKLASEDGSHLSEPQGRLGCCEDAFAVRLRCPHRSRVGQGHISHIDTSKLEGWDCRHFGVHESSNNLKSFPFCGNSKWRRIQGTRRFAVYSVSAPRGIRVSIKLLQSTNRGQWTHLDTRADTLTVTLAPCSLIRRGPITRVGLITVKAKRFVLGNELTKSQAALSANVLLLA